VVTPLEGFLSCWAPAKSQSRGRILENPGGVKRQKGFSGTGNIAISDFGFRISDFSAIRRTTEVQRRHRGDTEETQRISQLASMQP